MSARSPISSLSTLQQCDVDWITRRLPKAVRELLKSRPDVFLAGGFIRSIIGGEEVNDIDLFAPSADVAQLVALLLSGGDQAGFVKSENAYTTEVDGITVQVIHRWTFRTMSECLESFDFTIACAAIQWSGVGLESNGKEYWTSLCSPTFYADLAAKRLVYRSPQRNEDAGGSLLRVLKFYKRGYRIPLDSLGALLARLMTGVEFNRIGGQPTAANESTVAQVVTGLLLEVDPNLAMRELRNQQS